MVKEVSTLKEKYTEPEMEIVKFEKEDVIKASNELPIIPIRDLY